MRRRDPTDDALRAGFTAADDLLDDGRRCPSPDDLLRSARGELTGARNEAIVEHLWQCGACAAAWRVARSLEGAEGRVPVPVPGPVRRGWLPWLPAVAAAVVMVAGLAAVFHLRTPAPEAPMREQQEVQLTSLLAPDASLPRDACVLRWSPGPPGTTWDVRVMTEDLDPVASAFQLERSEFTVAPEALSALPRGTTLLWQVTAHLPDDRNVASKTFRVTID